MKRILLLAALSVLAACGPKAPKMPADAIVLRSPDGQLELKFAVVDGVPEYTLDRAGKAVVLPSRLGYTLLDRENLDGGFTLTDSAFNSFPHRLGLQLLRRDLGAGLGRGSVHPEPL